MCAILGLYSPDENLETRGKAITAMAATLRHRGPNDWGQWHDESGVSIGHTRLSILDLSALGHQPMLSSCGRFVLTFNGEIYNFQSIRNDLESRGRKFRGHSDTEVLVEAISEYGIQDSLQKIHGMFAFGVWDMEKKKLTLVRDRAGEKPLYFGWNKKRFVFASELKALFAIPGLEKKIDPRALQFFFRYYAIPAPFSILEGICKLNPGHYVEINPFDSGRNHEQKPYWHFFENEYLTPNKNISEKDALQSVEKILTEVVSEQMMSDVPLGAFLSGGYDSTVVVALMQKVSKQPVRTFTIGFQDKQFNEAPFARSIADLLGTNHTELMFDEKDALAVVDSVSEIYDEPFADSSQLPTAVLARLAKSQVSVCLSGDGGDEVFGGYTRYFWASEIWRTREMIPPWLRGASSQLIQKLPTSIFLNVLRLASSAKGDRLGVSHARKKIDKFRRIANSETFFELYESLLTDIPYSFVRGAPPEINPRLAELKDRAWPTLESMMMAMDYKTYLPADIMVKVDRATMSVSLESRAPLLDARVVEAAGKIPTSILLKNGVSKHLLKQICWKYVPREMMERPKKGFGVPMDAWLRGELRDWAENLLSVNELEKHGLLETETIRNLWTTHLSGKEDLGFTIWNVCVFQSWYNRWMTN
jgi:asparagine synthase (glutamine-hydrolysing)